MELGEIDFEVWKALTARRATEDTTYNDVLRELLGLSAAGTAPNAVEAFQLGISDAKPTGRRGRGNRRYAIKRMSPRIEGDRLVVEFEDGERNSWKLPDRSDKAAIRRIRGEAIMWALARGASDGQKHHIMKVLTDAGFHLIGPRRPK